MTSPTSTPVASSEALTATTGTSSSPSTKPSLSGWFKQLKKSQEEDEISGASLSENFGRKEPEQPTTTTSSTSNEETKKSAASIINSIPSEYRDSPIFGVPLRTSVQYAHVSISLSDPESGEHFVYGHIPVVVAKCGVFLKKSATGVEGIFRLSGSARRIKELQQAFNTPPRFGKGLDWTGYNVHDAANVFRRYLNHLPEPIIPLQFYEQFRDPLREKPLVLEHIREANEGATSGDKKELEDKEDKEKKDVDTDDKGEDKEKTEQKEKQKQKEELASDIKAVVKRYETLISELPPLNRQLLMYILDLLSIFAARCEKNLMPAANLAAIFQPSLLSHPTHDMAPDEYHLSRAAIEFLIQHSGQFLSHIESVALAEYQERKKKGIVSSSAEFLKASTDQQPELTTTVLSPSTSPAPPGQQLNSSGVGGRPHSQSLSLSKQSPAGATRPSILRANTGESASETRLASLENNSTSSLLSTLRRTVSMSKRAGRRRSMSGSSVASSQRAQSPGPGTAITSPPSNPISIPEIVNTNEDEASICSPGYNSMGVSVQSDLSARASIDSRLPAPVVPQDNAHSLDEAMRYLATSPPLSTTTSDHFLYKHGQGNDSNASLSRSSVADNEEDDNEDSDFDNSRHHNKDDGLLSDTSREAPLSPRRNVSKWRRSLMKFNLTNPNGVATSTSTTTNNNTTTTGTHLSDHSGEELLSPPTLSSSSRSHSPHRWFRRMKSQDKKVSHSASTSHINQGLGPSSSQTQPFSDGDVSEAEPL